MVAHQAQRLPIRTIQFGHRVISCRPTHRQSATSEAVPRTDASYRSVAATRFTDQPAVGPAWADMWLPLRDERCAVQRGSLGPVRDEATPHQQIDSRRSRDTTNPALLPGPHLPKCLFEFS